MWMTWPIWFPQYSWDARHHTRNFASLSVTFTTDLYVGYLEIAGARILNHAGQTPKFMFSALCNPGSECIYNPENPALWLYILTLLPLPLNLFLHIIKCPTCQPLPLLPAYQPFLTLLPSIPVARGNARKIPCETVSLAQCPCNEPSPFDHQTTD